MQNTTSNKPVSLATHATIEPVAGILFIAAPFIFGFSDNSAATTTCIVLGVAVLLTGMMTRWRMAIVKLIPLGTHRMMDLMIAAIAIVSPFVFGFSDDARSATIFLIVMGIAEAGIAMLTRWDPTDEFAVAGRHTGRASPTH